MEIIEIENQQIILKAGTAVTGGFCITKIENEKTTLIEGALPGEIVKVQITKDFPKHREAKVIEVIEASPNRITPPCETFKKGCGGCQWQYGDLDIQQQMKIEIVEDCLTRIAKIHNNPSITTSTYNGVEFIKSVSEFGYRTTMRFANLNQKPALRSRSTNDLIMIEDCLIAHPDIQNAIKQQFAARETDETVIRISETTKQLNIYNINNNQIDNNKNINNKTSNHETNNNENAANEVSNSKTTNQYIEEVINNKKYKVSAQSFFQSGLQSVELLTETINSLIPSDLELNTILDAYAGVGILGAEVVRKHSPQAKLISIEQSNSSSTDALINLSDLNAKIFNCEVARIPSKIIPKNKVDLIIADPPRTGLGKLATKRLASFNCNLFILVSCDPASFARDVTLLSSYDYILDSVKVLDLYPQTHHVEIVSKFIRQPNH